MKNKFTLFLFAAFVSLAVFIGCSKEVSTINPSSGIDDVPLALAPSCPHYHCVDYEPATGNCYQQMSCISCHCMRRFQPINNNQTISEVSFEGVAIDYTHEDLTTYHRESDSEGTWDDSALPDGYYTVVVSVDGYAAQYDTIIMDGGVPDKPMSYRLIAN
jgi:hypothetical protein